MKWMWTIVMLVTVVALSACSSGRRLEGINVGNGNVEDPDTAVYASPYKFRLKYRRELRLQTEAEDKKIRIDNAPLAAESDRVSRIEFQVKLADKDYTRFSDSRKLEEHLPRLREQLECESGETFLEVGFPGARGFYLEKRQGAWLDARYAILTTNFDLIEIEIHAQAFANGLAWVAPIVHTFTFDAMPPVIHEFGKDLVFHAGGEDNWLTFRATDDYSGISEFQSGCGSFRQGAPGASGDAYLSVCGRVKALGGDWYAMQVHANAFRPAGPYYLHSFGVTDNAGNVASLYPADSAFQGTFAVPVATVVNAGKGDTTPPVVHAIETPGVWRAGAQGLFRFRATDEGSGIGGFQSGCGAFVSVDHPSATLSVCGTIRSEGADWYSMDISVNAWRPGGEYYLRSFTVPDRAGNSTSFYADGAHGSEGKVPRFYGGTTLAVARVTVVSTGPADFTAPVVHEFRVPADFEPGKPGTIEFRATDDLSGISGFQSGCGSFRLVDEPHRAGASDATLSVCGAVRSLGNDWYSMDVSVNAYRPAGEYYLSSFGVADRAGNSTNLWWVRPSESPEGHSTQLPAPRARLVK